MFFITILSEALLYLCFALLAGTFILRWVPANSKPPVNVSISIQLVATMGIAVLSFIPLIQLVTHLTKLDGLGSAFENILLSFRVGNAWLFTFIICIVLAFYITLFGEDKRKISIIGEMILLFLLTIGVAWSSHAGSIQGVYGIGIHALHLIAVSTWAGVLLVVSWFSRQTTSWLPFLKWFHLTAIICFLLIVLSGILLANVTTAETDYKDALLVSYGQGLLLKLLFVMPLTLFALINGFWMKHRLKRESSFNPKPWVRAEFLIITIIFILTGIFNEQSPPMNIDNLIAHSGYAPILNLFYQGTLEGISVSFIFTEVSIIFGILALSCLGGSLVLFKMKQHVALSFLASVLFVLMAYFAMIQSIAVN